MTSQSEGVTLDGTAPRWLVLGDLRMCALVETSELDGTKNALRLLPSFCIAHLSRH